MKTTKLLRNSLKYCALAALIVSSNVHSVADNGPGTLLGARLSYYNNGYFDINNDKKEKTGPSRNLSVVPTFQVGLGKGWATNIGLGINSYKSEDLNTQYNTVTKENSYGLDLGFYHYCEDPCDEDDWYPFGGFEMGYYSGTREYVNTNNMTKVQFTENGKILNISERLVGGAYYRVSDNVGLFGSFNLVSMDNYRTYPNKSNTTNGWGSTRYNFLNGARIGAFVKLGGK